MRRELSEKEILDTVRDIRHEAPGIGAYKLYLMLKELYPDGMRGRDWFYGLMHDQGIDRQQDQPIVGGRHHLYRHR